MTIAALDLKSNLNFSAMNDRDLAEAQAACSARSRTIVTDAKNAKRSNTPEELDEAEAYLTRADGLAAEINTRRRQQNLVSRADLLAQGATIVPTEGTAEDRNDIVNNPDSGKYSILRAINRLVSRQPLDGYEGEISQEIARRTGKQATGFYMPAALRMRRRMGHSQAEKRGNLDPTAGAGMIPYVYDTEMIEFLRANRVLAAWGATMLNDLVGKLELPVKTATSSAYWVSGTTAITQTALQTNTIELTANTCGASTKITRSMLTQTSFDLEAMVRQDITDTLGQEIDRVGLNGSGSGAEPEGLMVKSGVPTYAIGTNGGAPSRAVALGLEALVEIANANFGNLKYVTSPKGKGKLKGTPLETGYPVYLWSDMNDMNGYKGLTTSLIPTDLTKGTGEDLTALLFGNGEDIVVGMWGAADIVVDPYSGSKSGSVDVTILQDVDIGFRRLESFARCLDMVC